MRSAFSTRNAVRTRVYETAPLTCYRVFERLTRSDIASLHDLRIAVPIFSARELVISSSNTPIMSPRPHWSGVRVPACARSHLSGRHGAPGTHDTTSNASRSRFIGKLCTRYVWHACAQQHTSMRSDWTHFVLDNFWL